MMTLAQIFGRIWGILSVIQKYLCLWKSFRNQATKLLLTAFINIEHSSTQSSTCSITKDVKMTMARWLSKYFSSVLKSIIVQNIGGRGF